MDFPVCPEKTKKEKNEEKYFKKHLKYQTVCDIITKSHEYANKNTERYRSGHNGADSKSVCANAHEGSNPSLSAKAAKSAPEAARISLRL